MANSREISITRFWTVTGTLIILIIGSWMNMASTMAVHETRLKHIEKENDSTGEKIETLINTVDDIKALVIEINTNQKRRLEKEK